MRELRYSVACSLDGYIAGPQGEFDWIPDEPEIDFAAMYAGFSALVMGRHSHAVYVSTNSAQFGALPVYVYSRSLAEGTRDGVTYRRDAIPHVRALKAEGEGKPLWLWGGGSLFRALSEAGLVDSIEVAIIPILLGQGIQLLPSPARRLPLALRSQQVFKTTGIVVLDYRVIRDDSAPV